MPTKWTHLDMALVRVETTDGVAGWGDAFAYSCLSAVMGAIRNMVAPLVIGRESAGRPIMPHSPYFGPGYWATLQLAACIPHAELFEYLYIWPDADVGLNLPRPQAGQVAVPGAPGSGSSQTWRWWRRFGEVKGGRADAR